MEIELAQNSREQRGRHVTAALRALDHLPALCTRCRQRAPHSVERRQGAYVAVCTACAAPRPVVTRKGVTPKVVRGRAPAATSIARARLELLEVEL